jgi:hypothetical protein
MLRTFLLLILATASLFAQTDAKKKRNADAKGDTPGQGSRKAMAELATATAPSAINVAPGFKVELLYTVPKADQGSWVSLCLDPKGRIIASDQYGGLYRLTLPAIGTSTGTKIEHLAIDFTKVKLPTAPADASETQKKKDEKAPVGPRLEVGAHGLLYASTASTSWSAKCPTSAASGACATPTATTNSTK